MINIFELFMILFSSQDFHFRLQGRKCQFSSKKLLAWFLGSFFDIRQDAVLWWRWFPTCSSFRDFILAILHLHSNLILLLLANSSAQWEITSHSPTARVQSYVWTMPSLPVSHLPDNTIWAWDLLLDNFKTKAKNKNKKINTRHRKKVAVTYPMPKADSSSSSHLNHKSCIWI